jgi:hypothetical protein
MEEDTMDEDAMAAGECRICGLAVDPKDVMRCAGASEGDCPEPGVVHWRCVTWTCSERCSCAVRAQMRATCVQTGVDAVQGLAALRGAAADAAAGGAADGTAAAADAAGGAPGAAGGAAQDGTAAAAGTTRGEQPEGGGEVSGAAVEKRLLEEEAAEATRLRDKDVAAKRDAKAMQEEAQRALNQCNQFLEFHSAACIKSVAALAKIRLKQEKVEKKRVAADAKVETERTCRLQDAEEQRFETEVLERGLFNWAINALKDDDREPRGRGVSVTVCS